MPLVIRGRARPFASAGFVPLAAAAAAKAADAGRGQRHRPRGRQELEPILSLVP